MTVKFVDDDVVFEPPAFRDVLERLAEVSIEDRQHRQTGPKTEAGKDRSKRNATRHGLAGKGVVLPEDVQVEVDAMIAELTAKYRPVDAEDFRLIRDCAVGYARQYEAITQQTLLLTLRSEKAASDWDSSRLVEVEEIAARLRKNPGLTVAQLQASTPGTLWMIRQWKHLHKALQDHGDWSPEEQDLAQDLCGLLPRLREHDPLRIQRGTIEHRMALVKGRIRRLRGLIGEGRRSLEHLERLMVIEGFIPAAGAEYRRLKRYEREARNTCERAFQALEARRLERLGKEREEAERIRLIAPMPPANDPALPRPSAPRPPKPLLTADDVVKAVMGPNPPANLMRRLEKETEEINRRLGKALPAAAVEGPSIPVEAESAATPEPTACPPGSELCPPTPATADKPKKAPRDYELDAEALKRREERRSKRKCKKHRR